jgi:hypothetical protein
LGNIFWRWAHFFLINIAKMIWAQFLSKNRPKFTIISSTFGLLFVLKFPNVDQIFLWAKVLIYQGSLLGDIWTNLGAFFAPFWAKFRQIGRFFRQTSTVTLAFNLSLSLMRFVS